MFDDAGIKFMFRTLYGRKSSDSAESRDSITDYNSSSRAAAGRLMGMDEAAGGFARVLGSDPKLLVEDLDEGKLGLLRLSFNFNPAMVARVTAWNRSQW